MLPVYVSFTSTPERLPLITPMLESLKQQTYQNFTCILWLCHYYKRSKKNFTFKQLPSFLKKDSFLTTKFCSDFGSNTKLYPLLETINNPNAILVTADDDTIYPPHWLEGLINAFIENPSRAYGYRGKIFKRQSFQFPFTNFALKKRLSYRASKTLILSENQQPQEVDVLTGVWGILYQRSFFNKAYFNLKICPEALHNDDIWANGHLAKKGIPRICLSLREPFNDIQMEKQGVKRLWDSINNGKGLNDKVLAYFKHDFDRKRSIS